MKATYIYLCDVRIEMSGRVINSLVTVILAFFVVLANVANMTDGNDIMKVDVRAVSAKVGDDKKVRTAAKRKGSTLVRGKIGVSSDRIIEAYVSDIIIDV